MADSAKEEKPFYKSEYYFSLDDASNEVSVADGVKETAAAAAKFAGKALFNVGLLAGKTSFLAAKGAITHGPRIVANIAEQNLSKNGHRMSDEDRARAEAFVKNNK